MASAEAAKLIASLTLNTKGFMTGVATATKGLGTLEGRLGKIGGIASKGLGTAAGNLAKLGAVAAVGLGAAVASGIGSLAELEDATTSVDGAIKTMGLTGKVTSKQVADWANEIESDVQAAFDDKVITAASGSLIRYGKVTPKNLKPAMVVMTDLAARTGDVAGAGKALGKALADPAKATGALRKAGIILTADQEKQIKSLAKLNDKTEAQAALLRILSGTTSGAAAAMHGPYKDALETLGDVAEDAKRALAEGFLPVLMRISDILKKKLADPKVIEDIRGLGKSLAGAFDKAVTMAQNIPWDSIKDAMKLAGQGAKAALDLFTGLPPWVQTAVLTGWGLNKLTGGALGGIIGELGKGLVKGVLGMTAGVVHLTAGTVNGLPGGGVGAVGGGGKGITGKIGTAASAITKVFMVGMAAAVAVELAGALGQQSTELRGQSGEVKSKVQTLATSKDIASLEAAINTIDAQFRDPLNDIALQFTNPLNGVRDDLVAERVQLVAALDKARQSATLQTTMQRAEAKGAASQMATLQGMSLAAARGSVSAALATASAIRAKRWSVAVTVPVAITTNVSVRDVSRGNQVTARYNNGARIYEP